jgi:hypothetical protein
MDELPYKIAAIYPLARAQMWHINPIETFVARRAWITFASVLLRSVHSVNLLSLVAYGYLLKRN